LLGFEIKSLRLVAALWPHAERWVESCRRELMDHVIALNDKHLRRLLSDYVRYYNDVSYCPPRFVVENPSVLC
jgi:hypothetical protein